MPNIEKYKHEGLSLSEPTKRNTSTDSASSGTLITLQAHGQARFDALGFRITQVESRTGQVG